MIETDKKPRKPGHGFQKGQVANPKGRTPGVKNKTTIFKEAMLAGAENIFVANIEKIADVVCAKAVDGDMTAAKMVFDRLIPQRKAVDINHGPQKDHSIQIVIQSLEDKLNVKAAEIVEADYEEVVVNEQQSKTD